MKNLYKRYKDRIEYYNKKGELHRENNQPAVHYFDGNDFYFVNGKLHNEKGPAITWWDNSSEFYLNGKRLKDKFEHRKLTQGW